jgi:protein phosphatase
MHILSTALSNIGKKRRNNEDRCVCDDTLLLYGVADGIGGLPRGAEAAQVAITTLRAAVSTLPDGVTPNLTRLTHRVNRAVCNLASQISPPEMGTTLTFGIVRDNFLCIAHVGDSRCYQLREGKLTALTTDHTVENDFLLHDGRDYRGVDFRMLNEAQRKSLTRCIGQYPDPVVDTSRVSLLPGDRYLFCTDGINKAVDDHSIAAILGGGGEPRHILSSLIAFANDAGGWDNASGVVVMVE